jgi:phosphate transport system permease protein
MTTSANNPQPPTGIVASSTFGIPRSWQLGDRVFQLLCQAAALAVIVLLLALVAILFWQAWFAIETTGWRFFASSTWDPPRRQFASLSFVYGTAATSLIAMIIAVPLGVGTAAFLSEIANGWVMRVGSFLVELLAAIPSVVYGYWASLILAPVVQHFFDLVDGPNQGGVGILSASLILSIMIVPYVAAVSFDVCRAVPSSQREASYALGATRWQTIWSVVLPYARPGIVGGCFLALGRALGETMAVTMLIGNNNKINLSPFAMGNTIPSVIANEFAGADDDLHVSALVELALVLLLVSVACNSVARLLLWRMSRMRKTGSYFDWFSFRKPNAAPNAAAASSTMAPTDTQVIAGLPANQAGTFEAADKADAAVGGPNSSAVTESSPGSLRGITVKSSAPYPLERGPMPADFRRNTLVNFLMTGVLGSCLVVTAGFLLFILGYLFFRGVGALNWEFFTNTPKPVGELGGGLANALFGSFMLVGLASALSIPVGILAAIYLAEYRSDRLGPIVRFINELLAGVPSIVIGIFAYYLVVKPMGHFSGWAGAFALGVMMIPILMRTTEDALRLVPSSLRHASYALGASQWQTVLKVTIPAAFPAIITAIFLAVARVVGETAPLLFTAFNSNRWPSSPNDATPSLPFFIYNYAASPYEDWHRQGWAAAFVLLTVVMILSLGVRLIAGRRAIATRQAG